MYKTQGANHERRHGDFWRASMELTCDADLDLKGHLFILSPALSQHKGGGL